MKKFILTAQYRLLNTKKGSAWVGIFIILIFLTSLGLALTTNVVESLRAVKKEEQLIAAQALAEAGIEKTIWKLNKGDIYTGETELTLATGQVDISVTDGDSFDTKIVTATGYIPKKQGAQRHRTVRVKLGADFNKAGLGFRYGIQVGSLGVIMENNTAINGSVYSGGDVVGGNTNSVIKGDVFASGAAGKIEKIIIGENNSDPTKRYGNAWSHLIKDSTIWGNATVRQIGNLQNSTVYGTTSYADPPPEESLPITDASLSTWEGWAAAGNNGVTLGTVTIPIQETRTLGPVKIDGDLIVDGKLRIKGIIWVTGNVEFKAGSYAYLDPIFGNDSTMIIADNPVDRLNDGKIIVASNAKICGSYALSNWTACDTGTLPADNKSYLMLLSTKNATTIADPAIFAGNNSRAVVYYTTQGMLEVAQNGALRAMTGGGIHVSNNAIIDYDIGLINANFSAGPGGSWVVKEWQVVYD